MSAKTDKPIVRGRFSRPKTIPVRVGDGTCPIFEECFENGRRVLRETGRHNLNEFVQASLEETKVYNIIERYNRGDDLALMQTVGQYIDVTGFPTNLREAHDVMLNMERDFEKMDYRIKQLFNNSCADFINSVGDGTLQSRLASLNIRKDNTDVKDGESNES